MKRGIFALILFLLVLPITMGADEIKVFDSWISYNGEIEYEDTIYKITSNNVHLDDETAGKVLIKKDADRFVISYGECLSDTLYEYCFENRSFDREEVDIDNQGILQPALKLKLVEYELVSELEKTKTFSQNTFFVDDEAQVTITLENVGDNTLNNIKLTEIVPENFKVIKSSLPFVGNRLEANLNLFSGSQWTLTYTIRALQAEETEYESIVTYDTIEEESIKETFGSKTLQFEESHTFEVSEIEETYFREDKETIDFTIENTDTTDITIQSFKIKTSPQIQVTGKKSFTQIQNNLYSAEKITIEPDEKDSFNIVVEFPFVGTYEIEYEAIIQVRDKVFTYNKSLDIEVTLDGVTCSLDIPDKVNASTIVEYKAIVGNGEKETFYELKGAYNIINEEGEYTINTLNKDVSLIADKGEFVVPFQFEEQEYNVTHHVTYRTQDNQYFTCESSKIITANPAVQLIDMKTHFKNEEASRNETTILIIELENVLDVPIEEDIQVYFSSIHGKATPRKLKGLSETQTIEVEVQLYEYVTQGNATITTNIKIPELKDYADSSSATISINNPFVGEAPKDAINTTDLIEEVKQKDNQKKNLNFFEKIVLYMKNFFK